MEVLVKRIVAWLILSTVIGLSVSLHARADTQARDLAASCAACHGTNGYSVGGTPVLAGLAKVYFIKQMQDFKSGKRQASVMNRHAKGYNDSQIEKLADYFANQERRP